MVSLDAPAAVLVASPYQAVELLAVEGGEGARRQDRARLLKKRAR